MIFWGGWQTFIKRLSVKKFRKFTAVIITQIPQSILLLAL
ncbi:hypothetical protein ASZ90_003151 [hydrocarbon metagenome]|uniref:Uncharacterized protein n=1 Tax=hydrocarbon metagenome TaxID=938273 RepID=A0A0W8G3C1_9ZZZZ